MKITDSAHKHINCLKLIYMYFNVLKTTENNGKTVLKL